MADFRPFSTAVIFVVFAGAFIPIGVSADIRVWTDREEVILKGTLQGIETLPGGAAKGLPAAPRPNGLPPKSVQRPQNRTFSPTQGLTVADFGRKMPPGSTLVLKKGRYLGGTITHPLTVRCEPGAVISGAGQKAALRIDSSPVVIDGCMLRDSRNAQNSAGIWAEPRMKVLTVRNSSFVNNGNGILVGNRQQSEITIENSVFDGNGAGGQAHQIYISSINAKLVVRGSTFRNTAGDGHVIKTGAHTTIVEDTKILGSGQRYSRAIDAFAGGELRLNRVQIEHGPNANSDVIGYGAEIRRSPDRARHSVSFANVTVNCLRQNGCLLIQSWLSEPKSVSGVTTAGGRVDLNPTRK